ncbi:MAG: class B sortase [[Eubacterium] saphenum]|nr:class B sortase [[Eubacterium] saphenum]
MANFKEKENIFIRILKYLIPWKGDKPTEIIRKIVFLAALVTLIVSGTNLILAQVNRITDNSLNEEITEIYHGTAASKVEINTESREEIVKEHPEIQERFIPLLEINKDTVGWLTVGNEDFIDYPVLQGDDNKFYLSHNFRKEESRSGSLFLDYRNTITADNQSANIVIYGHNMQSGEYFGKLIYYFNYAVSQADHNDISFYKEHPTITFSTLYKTSTYKIFGGMIVNTQPEAGEVFKYHNIHNFATKAEFDDYCAKVLDRSTFINPDVDLKYGDNLMTLSTCVLGTAYGNTDLRWVMFAREVREGEDETVDVSKAYANPSPLFYDLYYATRGGEWKGRGWDESIIQGYKKDTP